MHSSVMRTVRSSVSQHALGGGVSQHALGRGGVCPGGCLPRRGVVYPSVH